MRERHARMRTPSPGPASDGTCAEDAGEGKGQGRPRMEAFGGGAPGASAGAWQRVLEWSGWIFDDAPAVARRALASKARALARASGPWSLRGRRARDKRRLKMARSVVRGDKGLRGATGVLGILGAPFASCEGEQSSA